MARGDKNAHNEQTMPLETRAIIDSNENTIYHRFVRKYRYYNY